MAHFAEIDETNIVIRVVTISNEEIVDDNGEEQESLGIAKCKELFGNETNWIQCSYNSNFRAHYPASGYIYDTENDAFIPKKPYESYLLDKTTYDWVPPVPRPDSELDENGQPLDTYYWDENQLNWVLDTEISYE